MPTLQKTGIPGPQPDQLPAVFAAFAADPVTTLADLADRYGPMFRLPIGDRDTVFLNESTTVEKVLRLDFATFGMSSQAEKLNRPLLGRSMPIVTDHRYWEELHAIMLPMFTPRMLRQYFEQTVNAIAEEVEHLAKMAGDGQGVAMLEFVRHGIFVALSRTLFVRGVAPDDIDLLLGWFDKSDHYMNMRYLMGEGADTATDPAVVAGRDALERLNGYIYRLIGARRAAPAPEPEDMLDVLLCTPASAGRMLDDEEVRDNVMALFFGGQATTPSVITWAFGLISANPDKRERLLEEVDRVLGTRMPTFEDLRALEYTGMVLDEAMRLYPPFSFVAREALEDTELGGHHIAKGTNIGFVGWTIHRNPADWPDPETFEPERHTRAMQQGRNKCAFVAFGYGQRRCAGERVGRMEGVLMLAMISQRLLLDRVGGGMSPLCVRMSIKPADGLPMTVFPR